MRIDAAGNLVQPLRPGQQDPQPQRLITGFQSFSEMPADGAARGSPGPMQNLRAFWSFKVRSGIAGLLLLQVVLYFTSCWIVPPRAFIKPRWEALWKIGSSNGPMERCAFVQGGMYILELRRLVVAIFLHLGLSHLVMNGIFQVMLGPKFEEIYGLKRFLALFIGTGFCGNLLSDAFRDNGVGASGSCYGFQGAFVAQVLLRWPTLDEHSRWMAKMILMGQGVMNVLWEVTQWSTLDHYGHVGGFVSGVALGCVLAPGEGEGVGEELPGSSPKRRPRGPLPNRTR